MEAARQTSARAAEPEGRSARVLIADDEKTNRLLLRAILAQDGHQVIEAENGAQAVTLFERERPELVLMDVMMPVMDGYEATRHIKALAGERFVPVIFLTALNDEEALAACVAAGGDDFLTKPYKRTILLSKINAMQRIHGLYHRVRDQHGELTRLYDQQSRDQQVAERIFSSAVNGRNVVVGAVRTLLRPAATFNGDLVLTAHRPTGELHVFVGDATSHGLAAAIGALPVSEILHAMTAKGFGGADILREMNKKLYEILPTGMFMAGCLLSLGRDLRTAGVWNGGLPEVIVVDGRDGRIRQRLASGHLPLGISASIDPVMDIFEVQAGDRILIYSDGLIEARNPAGEMFGNERLAQILEAGPGAGQVCSRVEAALDDFCGGAVPEDDVTFVEVPCDAAVFALPATRRLTHRSGSRDGEWTWELALHGPSLRSVDPVPLAIGQLHDLLPGHAHQQTLYTVLSELYNNALDHGVLRLNSRLKESAAGFTRYYTERDERLAALADGFVHVRLRYVPGAPGPRLTIRVEDSGAGFDHAQQLAPPSGASPADPTRLSGRGITLVRSLCESLRFEASGNCVEAVYAWTE